MLQSGSQLPRVWEQRGRKKKLKCAVQITVLGVSVAMVTYTSGTPTWELEHRLLKLHLLHEENLV
jgi:hypothetical protein